MSDYQSTCGYCDRPTDDDTPICTVYGSKRGGGNVVLHCCPVCAGQAESELHKRGYRPYA